MHRLGPLQGLCATHQDAATTRRGAVVGDAGALKPQRRAPTQVYCTARLSAIASNVAVDHSDVRVAIELRLQADTSSEAMHKRLARRQYHNAGEQSFKRGIAHL